MSRYLSIDQVCEKVPSTTPGYWAQHRFKGTGPVFLKPSAKVVLYDEDSLDEWLQKSARTQTGPQAA
jgi:hypothetical protein